MHLGVQFGQVGLGRESTQVQPIYLKLELVLNSTKLSTRGWLTQNYVFQLELGHV